MKSAAPAPETASRTAPVLVLRLAGTLLALGLMIYLVARQWSEVAEALRHIPLTLFLLAFSLMFISRLAITGRWYVLLKAANVPISLGQSARITFAGLFANNFLPSTIGGDVARLAGTLILGLDQAVCLASLVVDRLVGMATMATALPFALPVLWAGLVAPVTLSPGGMLAAGVAAPAQGWIKKAREKAIRIVRRLLQALILWKEKPQSLLLAMSFSWFHMLCWIGLMSLVLNSMHQNISIWLIAGLWSAEYFVSQIPISIGGLGVQELLITFLFTNFGGISSESSLVLALLLRTLQMLVSLPGAVFVPGILARADRKGAAHE